MALTLRSFPATRDASLRLVNDRCVLVTLKEFLHVLHGSDEYHNARADNAGKEESLEQMHAEESQGHGQSVRRCFTKGKHVEC